MRRSTRAFTLIEMLVVIAIIGILAGLVFKMMVLAKRQAEKAQCIAKLEKLASAINEFRAEYGIYPPVRVVLGDGSQLVTYVFENTWYQSTPPGQASYLRDNYLARPGNWPTNNPPIVFQMGLLSYLVPRLPDYWPTNTYWPDGRTYKSRISHTNSYQWVGDVPRDVDAKLRWSHFLEGVLGLWDPWEEPYTCTAGTYFNDLLVARDPWDRDFKYECKPPYLSYKLWSIGPDHRDNTGDEIFVNMMDR